jgi:hypothetical protein
MKQCAKPRRALRGLNGRKEANRKLIHPLLTIALLAVFLLPALTSLPVSADGSTWSAMTSGTTNHLWNVWGSSATDVFAVGIYGTILHYNGSAGSSGGMPTWFWILIVLVVIGIVGAGAFLLKERKVQRPHTVFGFYLPLSILIICCVLGFAGVAGLISLPHISLPGGGGDGAEDYQYWKGEIPNSYYLLNIYGERAAKVTGKPFMILKYDKVTLEITDCEFGLSEVTQEGISNPSDTPAPPEPTLDAEVIDFHEKLGLKSPVDAIVSWNINLPGGVSKSITNGVQQFSFIHPTNGIGPGSNSEKWTFVYTSGIMTGGVENIDTYYYMGRESETNAFNLLKQ